MTDPYLQRVTHRQAAWYMVKKIVPPILQGLGVLYLIDALPTRFEIWGLFAFLAVALAWGVWAWRDVGKGLAEARELLTLAELEESLRDDPEP